MREALHLAELRGLTCSCGHPTHEVDGKQHNHTWEEFTHAGCNEEGIAQECSCKVNCKDTNSCGSSGGSSSSSKSGGHSSGSSSGSSGS